jgi:glycosyltransferase involved in cell wall biosynthesis
VGHATRVLEACCAQSEHRDRIHVLGHRYDVPELLAAADVFAFPSRYEGFGGALVEAMALGVPAVVSDIPALREVVDGTAAILVPPGDPVALAAALARVLDEHAWATDLGARARSMFLEKLTTAHSSPRMLELYKRIAGDQVPASPTARAAQPRLPPELISVVVPVLNEVSDLPEQLAALAAQTYCGRWEVIVCDNGSVDGTPQLAASWCDRLPNLRVVNASDRRGINHARNVGAKSARGDFIAFCDGDDVVSPGWLRELAEVAPLADIVGGALDTEYLNTASATSRQGLPDRLPLKHEFLRSVSGGNCGVWRAVAMELGWDERFTFGGSDIEFAWRAQLAGYRIGYAPHAVISVREQDRLPALARHWYRYGESGGKLFRAFRHYGMRRSRVGEAARVWAWLLIHTADVWGSPEARRRWVQLASYRVGRLAGSVRERTLFL